MNVKPSVIHTTRAIYAMNWYDISPGLIYIQKAFSLTQVQLGILLTAFYIGVGIFQIPAGYISTRIGNRNTATIGILGLGIASIISAASPTYSILVATRFFAGVSSAMFFSPAIGTLRSATTDSTYNFHVNFFNGSFNLGAGIGVAGWEAIDSFEGFRAGFLIAGIITVAAAVAYFFTLREVNEERIQLSPTRNLLNVLRNRGLWIYATAGTASVISENVAAQIVVYYMEKSLNVPAGLASVSGTLFLVFGFVGGIIGGLLIGKFRNVKVFFIFTTALTSMLMIALAYFTNIYIIFAIVSILGAVTVQGFSAIYIIITRSMKEKAQTTTSLSVVNAAQEIPGSIWPSIFSIISGSIGFFAAWNIIGVVSLAFMFLVIIPAGGRRSGSGKSFDGT
ncbi:MAG: MFS transporter [Candidatus Thermoplasmatota archaeon]|nr:MFS transporter [Candidatus Thermoplasmatota archaeon]